MSIFTKLTSTSFSAQNIAIHELHNIAFDRQYLFVGALRKTSIAVSRLDKSFIFSTRLRMWLYASAAFAAKKNILMDLRFFKKNLFFVEKCG